MNPHMSDRPKPLEPSRRFVLVPPSPQRPQRRFVLVPNDARPPVTADAAETGADPPPPQTA